MSSRIFQSVIIQMKDATERTIGVVDNQGFVVACSELSSMGEQWTGAVAAVNAAGADIAHYEGRSFRQLTGHKIGERAVRQL